MTSQAMANKNVQKATTDAMASHKAAMQKLNTAVGGANPNHAKHQEQIQKALAAQKGGIGAKANGPHPQGPMGQRGVKGQQQKDGKGQPMHLGGPPGSPGQTSPSHPQSKMSGQGPASSQTSGKQGAINNSSQRPNQGAPSSKAAPARGPSGGEGKESSAKFNGEKRQSSSSQKQSTGPSSNNKDQASGPQGGNPDGSNMSSPSNNDSDTEPASPGGDGSGDFSNCVI